MNYPIHQSFLLPKFCAMYMVFKEQSILYVLVVLIDDLLHPLELYTSCTIGWIAGSVFSRTVWGVAITMVHTVQCVRHHNINLINKLFCIALILLLINKTDSIAKQHLFYL